MKRALYLAAIALASCGGDDDPCSGVSGACVTLHVHSATIDRIDQLELDVLYGNRHGTTTTQVSGGGAVSLPLVTALEIDLDGEQHVGVVAAGKLSGVVKGTGAAAAMVGAAEHTTFEIELAPPKVCVAGTLYCGGDKLAGDSQTLYECNGGGVPHARGRCLGMCMNDPNKADYCIGEGGPCVAGKYCGGDKLDGDPQTLYTCSGGSATMPMECPNGCIVNPPGQPDACR